MASSRCQWALPDLNRECQISVGTAGPRPRAPDLSGHGRAVPTPENARIDDRKNVKIDAREIQRERQHKCQKVCQIECQKECESICQKEGQIEWLCIYIYIQYKDQMVCQKLCPNNVSGQGTLEESIFSPPLRTH